MWRQQVSCTKDMSQWPYAWCPIATDMKIRGPAQQYDTPISSHTKSTTHPPFPDKTIPKPQMNHYVRFRSFGCWSLKSLPHPKPYQDGYWLVTVHPHGTPLVNQAVSTQPTSLTFQAIVLPLYHISSLMSPLYPGPLGIVVTSGPTGKSGC